MSPLSFPYISSLPLQTLFLVVLFCFVISEILFSWYSFSERLVPFGIVGPDLILDLL